MISFKTFLIEKLDHTSPLIDWIHDFQSSNNKRFKGKSKKQRWKMAVGAWWHATNKGKTLKSSSKKKPKSKKVKSGT